ncbi:uncharacterized protein LOC124143072 [Haliotis rufescens]|uniref:uncharacterized protein LOC124143072 n=1 Tax=Haliotis rufescens TaxID=6454 RepID=UPI00201EE97B|nr:uncharacterized protein LOC124143072 [Haliotis rufescens]
MSRRTDQPTDRGSDFLEQDVRGQKWPRDRLPPRRRQYDQFQEFNSETKDNKVSVLERLPIEYYQLSKTSRDKILTHRQETKRKSKIGGHPREGECNRLGWFRDLPADLTEDRPLVSQAHKATKYLSGYQARLKRELGEQRQTVELERKKEEELRKLQLVPKRVGRQQKAVSPDIKHLRKEMVVKSKNTPIIIPSAEPPTKNHKTLKTVKKPTPITLPVISTGSGISNGEPVWAMAATGVEIKQSRRRLRSKVVLPPIESKTSRQRRD